MEDDSNIDNACNGSLRKMTGLVSIEWEIADFKSLFRHRKCGPIAKSPTFEMRNATWSFEILSGDSEPEFKPAAISIELLKHSSETKCHSLNCQMMIQINRDEISERCLRTYRLSKGLLQFYVTEKELLRNMSSDAIKVLFTVYPGNEEESASNEGIDILSEQMKNLFLNGEDCDFSINVKGIRDFQVHRTILTARSPVLSAMLHHDMAEKVRNTTHIVDCEPDVFEHFLLYLYSGQVGELSWENVTHLYTLGDKYDMPHLRKECLQFMEGNLGIEVFCDVIALAVKHNVSALVKRGEDFFLKNANDILVTNKWQLFLKDNPTICNELFLKLLKRMQNA